MSELRRTADLEVLHGSWRAYEPPSYLLSGHVAASGHRPAPEPSRARGPDGGLHYLDGIPCGVR